MSLCPLCEQPILTGDAISITKHGELCHHECLVDALAQATDIAESDVRDYHFARGD